LCFGCLAWLWSWMVREPDSYPSGAIDARVSSDEENGRPNQALQTTPMTRSVYEKTIEFGRPQRGV